MTLHIKRCWLSLVFASTVLTGCAGGDGKSVPLEAPSKDPHFGSQYPNPHDQIDAALALIDTADSMAEILAGRSGDASAISADDVFDEYSGTIYQIGEYFLDGQQSAVIQAFLDTFGPADPFLNRPEIDEDDLKPGDILVSTTGAKLSQVIRAFGWGHYSHAFVYVGNGMITEAVGDGVQTVSLDEANKEAIRIGVLRDPTLSASTAQSIVEAANDKVGSAYNWKGLAAVAYQKNAALAGSFSSGFSAMAKALTTVDDIPGDLGSNGSFFCSQLVTASYEEAGNALFTKDGASPCDIVRLADTGRLQLVGRLPL